MRRSFYFKLFLDYMADGKVKNFFLENAINCHST